MRESYIPNGVRSTLRIEENYRDFLGRYSCIVVNAYGSDSLEIVFRESSKHKLSVLIFNSILFYNLTYSKTWSPCSLLFCHLIHRTYVLGDLGGWQHIGCANSYRGYFHNCLLCTSHEEGTSAGRSYTEGKGNYPSENVILYVKKWYTARRYLIGMRLKSVGDHGWNHYSSSMKEECIYKCE